MAAGGYDYWLLDLDGTVVDVEWSYIRATFDTLGDRLGRSFTDQEVVTLWYGLNGSRDRWLRAHDLEPPRFWEVFDAIEDPQQRAAATYLHDDAELIGELDAPTGIVTHSRPRLTKAVLQGLDIHDWFDVVICCNDELGWKPDPDPVERAVHQLDVSGTGIYIGDSLSDIGAAWNAGLDAAHIERHSPQARRHCVLADHRLDTLTNLLPAATTAAD